MSVAEHTPGPWFVDQRYSQALGLGELQCIAVELSPDSGPHTNGRTWAVALVPCHPDYRATNYLNDSEAVANARLIAAAPDLLAEVQRLHEQIVAHECGEYVDWSDNLLRIQAVLAKAEGRT